MRDSSITIVPPMLYLPIHQDSANGPMAEIRRLADGRTTLLAYTALDRLADGCGAAQPWALLALEALEDLKLAQPFDVISLDVDVPGSNRRWGRLA